jgi:hypothetical protein
MFSHTTAFHKICIVLLLLLSLTGCGSKQQKVPEQELLPIKSIVVLPVEIINYDGDDAASKERVGDLEKGRQAVDQLLAEYFMDNDNVRILTASQRDAIDQHYYARCRTTAAITICQKYDADAVLLCTLHRFIEREGNEYSIVRPASVALDYKLVTADTNQTLCAGVYNETQQPLLDNMFKFFERAKRGFKWVTARALAKEGLDLKFSNCPYLIKP